MQYTLDENCEACNIKYTEWDYFRDTIKGLIDFIRWDHVILYSVVMLLMWGILETKWGLLLGYIICSLFQNLGGGLQGDFFDVYPSEEYPKFKCSAGIEDCEYCGNEYSHEFNTEYEKSLKWYHKLL